MKQHQFLATMEQHQFLAIMSDIEKQQVGIRNETLKVFSTGSNFEESSRIYTAFNEADKDHPGDTSKQMITTVEERLRYDNKFTKNRLNAIAKKELTNSLAKADIVIVDEDTGEETIVSKDVPVTALLEFEKHITQQIEVYKKIPTLDMNIQWVEGLNNAGSKCYIAPETKKTRSVVRSKETSFNPNSVKGSEKFPLEPRTVKEEVPVGTYVSREKSGKYTPIKKAELIQKTEKLLNAIKIARAKANKQKVCETTIGTDIISYLES